jgi:uncharacterized protein with HEPN domain
VPPTLADRVRHVLEAIEDMERILSDKSEREFAEDRFLRLGVERLFEIISEASRHIPQEMKTGATHIAWQRMADLGNWLRHAYHRIDAGLLWSIFKNDLPPLKALVTQIIRDEARR